MTEDVQENLAKVIFLGETGVGKTNLIKVSVGEDFDPAKLTTNTFSFLEKKFTYLEKEYIFSLWDTIGQERYRALAKSFFKDAQIVIFVYDITDRKSFEELNYWINEVDKELGKDYIKGVVGNKKDLFMKEEVSEEEGMEYAKEKNAKFKLTSAKKSPLGIIEFIEMLFKDYIYKKENIVVNKRKTIALKKSEMTKKTKKGRFC